MRWGREHQALALVVAAAVAACDRGPAPGDPQLVEKRDRLRAEKKQQMEAFARWGSGVKSSEGPPEGDMVLAVPVSFVEDLTERTLTGIADRISVHVRDLPICARGEVKVKMPIVGKKTVGRFEADVHVREIKGELGAGKVDIKLGNEGLGFDLPVEVRAGAGEASVHFTWDSRGFANTLCGDLAVRREVDGQVVPVSVKARGRVAFSVEGEELIIRPSIPMLDFRIQVEPSDASWAQVQALLDEKKGVCGFVLDQVDVMKEIRKELAKGFRIKVHTERLKPIRVPVRIAPRVKVKGREIALAVSPPVLKIGPRFVWLASDIEARVTAPAAPARP